MTPLKPKLTAAVVFKPIRSHAALFLVFLLSAICIFISFAFLWNEKEAYWIPLVVGLFTFLTGAIGWHRSQRDIDLHSAATTTYTDSHGNKLECDPRVSPASLHAFEKCISTLTNRQPLPAPNGLVDSQLRPIPGTQAEAQKITDRANAEAESLAKLALNGITQNPSETGIDQPTIDATDYIENSQAAKNIAAQQ